MSNSTFSGNCIFEGRLWLLIALSIGGAIGAGWYVGHLQTTCLIVIAAFIFTQGVRPYFQIANRLQTDRTLCLEEKNQLQDMEVELLEDLSRLDSAGAGSMFNLVTAIEKNKDRVGKKEAGELFLDVQARQWELQLTPLSTSAEQSALLGIVGSMIGMLSAIAGVGASIGGTGAADTAGMGNSFAQLFTSMSTMMSTTLFGAAGAFLILGLSSRASNAIEQHLAELRMFAALMAENEEENDNDNNYRLRRDVA